MDFCIQDRNKWWDAVKRVAQLRSLQNEENLLNKRTSTKFIVSYLVYGADSGVVLHSETFFMFPFTSFILKKTFSVLLDVSLLGGS
jgi:hypothetical protein